MAKKDQMQLPAAVKTVEVVRIRVDDIEPNSWNPFEMSTEKFETLCEEIRADGFAVPVQVVRKPEPIAAGEAHFRIVDGEHRWRAARAIGLEEIQAVVGEWDEDEQKAKTVRRNLIKGDINAVKFTKLFNEQLASGRFDAARLRASMAMTDERTFKGSYLALKEEKTEKAKAAAADGQRKLRAVADVGAVVRGLIEKHGETVPQSYIFFMYGGQMHLMVECDQATRQWADMVRAQAMAEGRDVNAVIAEWVGEKLGAT